MNKEEIEEKYGKYPEILDIKKINTLLTKELNKFEFISDVKSEVIDFLNSENIKFDTQEVIFKNSKGEDNSIKSLIINDKLVLLIVEDYTVWNKTNLKKDTAETIHFHYINNGFRIVWIKKFEWENPNKRTVLKSMILHANGKTKFRYFARNTVCEVIKNNELKDFFNASSFYGFRNASMAVCLKDKKTGEILQAMSFGHPYYGKGKYGENCLECIRSAGKPYSIVIGGMSKLMKFFHKEFQGTFDSILYYIDDAHYQTDSMDEMGFKFSHFAGGGVHNVWIKSGAMFMRTPALHKEIMFFQKIGEIYAVPDVGNSVYLYKTSESDL